MLAVGGAVRFELFFFVGGEHVSSYVFAGIVAASLVDGATNTEQVLASLFLITRAPYIGANGNWYVFNTNTGAFADSGIAASGHIVQSDWNQKDATEPDFIKNKPDILNLFSFNVNVDTGCLELASAESLGSITFNITNTGYLEATI